MSKKYPPPLYIRTTDDAKKRFRTYCESLGKSRGECFEHLMVDVTPYIGGFTAILNDYLKKEKAYWDKIKSENNL